MPLTGEPNVGETKIISLNTDSFILKPTFSNLHFLNCNALLNVKYTQQIKSNPCMKLHLSWFCERKHQFSDFQPLKWRAHRCVHSYCAIKVLFLRINWMKTVLTKCYAHKFIATRQTWDRMNNLDRLQPSMKQMLQKQLLPAALTCFPE